MIYRNKKIGFQTLLNDRSGGFEWRNEINFSSEELEILKNALRRHGYHEFKIFQFVRRLEEICRDVLFASSKPEKYSHQSLTGMDEIFSVDSICFL